MKYYLQQLQQKFFATRTQTLLSLISLLLLWKIVWPVVDWAVVKSLWWADADACRQLEGSGACWSFLKEKWRLIIFGLYPSDEQWRPGTVLIIFTFLFFLSQQQKFWSKKLVLIWGGFLLLTLILLRGGIFGLSLVERDLWGGLPLTLFLSMVGIVFSYPLGILLALARRSQLPLLKGPAVVFIELMRGVPLISLLFMASVMLPLFLPPGFDIDKILRAQVALILFYAAYMAEVVRGGLEVIPRGQFEAAEALGLHYPTMMRKIILPQALKVVIPPTINTCIGILKDTSLVVIISLFDLLYTMKLAQKDVDWLGFDTEAYVFVAFIYFFYCYSLSRFGKKLEEA